LRKELPAKEEPPAGVEEKVKESGLQGAVSAKKDDSHQPTTKSRRGSVNTQGVRQRSNLHQSHWQERSLCVIKSWG
jgi:hypothetical protein